MDSRSSHQKIAEMTDEGLFERLATAVLREFHPDCAELIHPGVTENGKTRKAPLDGAGFVPNADPPHLVAVHHTTSVAGNLQRKWLHDPAVVRPRKGDKPTGVAGDLVKTASIVDEERRRCPTLRATLILTTNTEPSELVLRDVKAAGRARHIDIDIWSASRIAHYLDRPEGQWIRFNLLGVEQTHLSRHLLSDLSRKSVAAYPIADDARTRVVRNSDDQLRANRRPLSFVLAESGFGKSVACHRALESHIKEGGLGLVISDQLVANSPTLEAAILEAARNLHPALALGENPLAFCTSSNPLMIVIEDINAVGEPHRLVTKLVHWALRVGEEHDARPWRVLCPIWPQALVGLDDNCRRQLDSLLYRLPPFSSKEACAVVHARAEVDGRNISDLEAASVAEALGHDPLLIGLYNGGKVASHKVIGEFVEASLGRAARSTNAPLVAELRDGLHALASRMLVEKQIGVSWSDIEEWFDSSPTTRTELRHLIKNRELLRETGTASASALMFRHDRVRDWLLIEAGAALTEDQTLPTTTQCDPFFAEILGGILVRRGLDPKLLLDLRRDNPLALFEALRLVGRNGDGGGDTVATAIDSWLDEVPVPSPAQTALRWDAIRILAQTDSPRVPRLAARFPDFLIDRGLAQLRNGDLAGAVLVCLHIEPGVGAPWRDLQIGHAKTCHGPSLTAQLKTALKCQQVPHVRMGLLRLAGHFADPTLGDAIACCWENDESRIEHLADYVWAAAQCCGDQAPRLLDPICDAWAKLSDESVEDHLHSPRDAVCADQLHWAMIRWPPVNAIPYLIARAASEDLAGPLTHLLESVDHPDAIEFIARSAANCRRSIRGTGNISPSLFRLSDDWNRRGEMSFASRNRLYSLWTDPRSDQDLRWAAFTLWAGTQEEEDLDLLRANAATQHLEDEILRARLKRSDRSAVPALINKLEGEHRPNIWWHFAAEAWTPELTVALDKALTRRSKVAEPAWGECLEGDHKMSEMVMRLPVTDSERLLLKHWEHVRFSPLYISAALYEATPELLARVGAAVTEAPDPAKLLQYISQHFGLSISGHPGLVRPEQVRAIAPYLHLMGNPDKRTFAQACNDKGWFDLRREIFDANGIESAANWSEDRCRSEFDGLIEPNRIGWAGYSVERMLASGIPWPEVRDIIVRWHDDRRTLLSLNCAAAAFIPHGLRSDLRLLRIHSGIPELEGAQILDNAIFAIQRRTLQ